MATATFDAQLRSYMGSRRSPNANIPNSSPASVPGVLFATVKCDTTSAQTLAVALPKGAMFKAVSVVDPPPATAVTWQMDLPAVSALSLGSANVVAAGATSAVGSKTVVAASLLKGFAYTRPITMTFAAGGGAGETLTVAIELLPPVDLGKENG